MNTEFRMREIIKAVCVFLIGFASGAAQGQGYPNKPIRMVVPFAPGGGADLMGRVVAQKLTAGLGQQIVVENRAGAAGRVGTEYVAKAPPDGYTLLLATSSVMITAPALYSRLPYEVAKDLAPISLAGSTAYVLVVHPSVPVKSVKELIALAKANPGRLNYSSSGPGGPAHLSGELLQSMAGVRMVHVPYKGSAPGTLALISGETDLMFSNLLPAAPQIKANKLRAIAITSPKRSTILPGVPTVSESGLSGFSVETLYGVLAPAGTSREIISRLNQEIIKGLQSPDTRQRLLADGSEVLVSTPEEFDKVIKTETAKWRQVIRQAGLKAEE